MPKFQSTLPLWGATDKADERLKQANISIHAPLVGSDEFAESKKERGRDFNPRSPCGERLYGFDVDVYVDGFQSTLPLWGATSEAVGKMPKIQFQSTLPLWGATDHLPGPLQSLAFQSTLPLWGATFAPCNLELMPGNFNPRSPCGERLGHCCNGNFHLPISIHAPLVGSDIASL